MLSQDMQLPSVLAVSQLEAGLLRVQQQHGRLAHLHILAASLIRQPEDSHSPQGRLDPSALALQLRYQAPEVESVEVEEHLPGPYSGGSARAIH